MTWTMDRNTLEVKIKRLLNRIKNYHDFELPLFKESQVSYGSEIGRGAEGIVNQCSVKIHSRSNLLQCAAKRVLFADIDSVQRSLDEIFILSIGMNCAIPPTIKLYGICITDNPFFCEPGDKEAPQIVIFTEIGISNLLDFYKSNATIPLSVTLKLWADISTALNTLHSKGIIHRDLKPDNILVVKVNKCSNSVISKIEVRIIDVGMAQHPQIVEFEDILGTVGYHSPEMLAEEGYDCMSDVFMLGILFIVTLLPLAESNFKLNKLLRKVDVLKKKGVLGEELLDSFNLPYKLIRPLNSMLSTMLEKSSKRDISLNQVEKLCKFYSEHYEADANLKKNEENQLVIPIQFKRSSRLLNKSNSMSSVIKSPTRLKTRARIIQKKKNNEISSTKTDMIIADFKNQYENFRWRNTLRSPLRKRNCFPRTQPMN